MSDKPILEMMAAAQPCCVGEITGFARGWSSLSLETAKHYKYFNDDRDGKLCRVFAKMWIRDFATDTVLLTDSGMVFKSEDDATLFKFSCPSQPIERAEMCCDYDEDDDYDIVEAL